MKKLNFTTVCLVSILCFFSQQISAQLCATPRYHQTTSLQASNAEMNVRTTAVKTLSDQQVMLNFGRVVYKGIDGIPHLFNTIIQGNQDIIYPNADNPDIMQHVYVAGDMVRVPNTEHTVYRGIDGRLQIIYRDPKSGTFNHGWVDEEYHTDVTKASADRGSIIATPQGIFYRNINNRIHRFYHAHDRWNHEGSDITAQKLRYDATRDIVYYIDVQGDEHAMDMPMYSSASTWNQHWSSDIDPDAKSQCATKIAIANTSLESNLHVYPNPVTEKMFLELEGDKIQSVKLMNIEGRIVREFQDVKDLNVSMLDAGMYLLQVQGENETYNQKIMKK